MKTIRLLLVDDDDDFRAATRRVLERRGIEVVEAESGEAALAYLATIRPDVVLLDLKMGGIDGLTTLERLRETHAELPVIILTGHGSYDDAVAGVDLGIVDFLQKPADLEQVVARIRGLVDPGRRAPLRERTVGELMVPPSFFPTVRADQSVSEAVRALADALPHRVSGVMAEPGHRSVVVLASDGGFLGMLRIADVLAWVVPPFVRDSPYGSCFTGMVVARCKGAPRQAVGELLPRQPPHVTAVTPLMEAVWLMTSNHLVNLPVLRGAELVGVLRDKDLVLEIATCLGVSKDVEP